MECMCGGEVCMQVLTELYQDNAEHMYCYIKTQGHSSNTEKSTSFIVDSKEKVSEKIALLK